MDAQGPAQQCGSCMGSGLEGYKPCGDCMGSGVEDRPQVEDRRMEYRRSGLGRVTELHEGRTTLIMDDGATVNVEVATNGRGHRALTIEHPMLHAASVSRTGRAVITILGDK